MINLEGYAQCIESQVNPMVIYNKILQSYTPFTRKICFLGDLGRHNNADDGTGVRYFEKFCLPGN